MSGAGDTVVAAFALARASGADHGTAVALANRAASVVVGKFGTATVTPEEILQDTDAPRLVPRPALSQLATTLRAKGKRIVTINGSFDVLHSGHLHILGEARQRGDVLIVGLNSDASVRSHKGPARPIVVERQRAEMLLALRMVDYVHIFDESDPIAFLKEIRPDVHVNVRNGEDCIESERSGAVAGPFTSSTDSWPVHARPARGRVGPQPWPPRDNAAVSSIDGQDAARCRFAKSPGIAASFGDRPCVWHKRDGVLCTCDHYERSNAC